jgi:hypothetical protein
MDAFIVKHACAAFRFLNNFIAVCNLVSQLAISITLLGIVLVNLYNALPLAATPSAKPSHLIGLVFAPNFYIFVFIDVTRLNFE